MVICALGIAFFVLEDESYMDGLREENISIPISLVMFFLLPAAEIIFGFIASTKGRSLYKNLNSGFYQRNNRAYQSAPDYLNKTKPSEAFLNASGQDIRAFHTYSNNVRPEPPMPSDATDIQTANDEAVKRLRNWRCPNCKKTNSMSDSFCGNCGTNQSVFY
ncbi:MAG: zinc ribbon domain-containing protein [Ruminiclostridium sp.]|nr:zinc ribbon domain-containing protein [Ruminiclostridium sp.]